MNSGLVAASPHAVVRRRAPGGTRLLIRKDHKPRLRPARCDANCARTRVRAHAIDPQVRPFGATRTFVSARCRNPFSGRVAKSDAAVLTADDRHIDEWEGDTALVNLEREARLVFDLRLEL